MNGTKIYIFGADDPDNARGLYLDGVVIDETAQVKPSFWSEVIRPALADRKGWVLFSGTPKGKGNLLYTIRDRALKNPDKWFYLELKASETGLIGPKELAELKEDMDEEEYLQEFECSFEAALVGSIYGRQLAMLERKGGIVFNDLYDPSFPVSLAIDIGYNDAASIWFWQIAKGELRFIDYMEQTGRDAEEMTALLELKPYRYDNWFIPHDAFHRTFQSKKSVFDIFTEFGAPVRKVPEPDGGSSVFNGNNAVRYVLRTFPVKISRSRCQEGIEALKNYSREWNVKTGQFNDNPKHDRWSHGADAFRYACLSVQMEDIKRSEIDVNARKPHLILGTDINSNYTLEQALKDHEAMMRKRANQGRARI